MPTVSNHSKDCIIILLLLLVTPASCLALNKKQSKDSCSPACVSEPASRPIKGDALILNLHLAVQCSSKVSLLPALAWLPPPGEHKVCEEVSRVLMLQFSSGSAPLLLLLPLLRVLGPSLWKLAIKVKLKQVSLGKKKCASEFLKF